MKAIRMMGLALVAFVATGAIAAGTAAAAPKLELTWLGVPYTGANVTAFKFLGLTAGVAKCERWTSGQSTTGKSDLVDELAGETGPYNGCFEEGTANPEPAYSITGSFTKLNLRWNGDASASGKVEIARPGPCVYLFNNVRATQAAAGAAIYEGSVTGYLVRPQSNISCAALETATVDIYVAYPVEVLGDGYYGLDTELRG